MAIKQLNFEKALALSPGNRHILLGNGFSIALKPDIFHYDSLYERADFSKIPYAKIIFEALDTHDFEAAIRLLTAASGLLPVSKTPS